MYLSIYIQSYIKMFTYGTHHINWSQVPRRRPHYCNSPGIPPLLCVALRWSPLGTAAQGPCGRPGYGGFPKDEEKHVLFFPTLTSVFLFLVLYPLLPPALLPHHSLTHLTHTHSSHSHIHTLTHSLTHSLTPSLARSLARSLCKRSDVRPGVSSVWVAAVGQCALPRGRVGQCALPRSRMYSLGFGWRPWISTSFAWQAWDNVHCQGVGCMPSGSAGVPGSPPLLRGRHGAMCTAKGSDVRPGVRLAPLGLRLFCVAGVGQCALLRGRRGTMCTTKGTMCIAGGFCVAGVGHCAHTHSHSLTHSHSCHHWLTRLITHTLTHSLTPSLARSLTHSLTLSLSLTHHSLTFSFTHLCMHIHTHIHKNSPTIIPPSLFYFLFPSCFSMLSLSLEKLVTCGVIWSYNFWCFFQLFVLMNFSSLVLDLLFEFLTVFLCFFTYTFPPGYVMI